MLLTATRLFDSIKACPARMWAWTRLSMWRKSWSESFPKSACIYPDSTVFCPTIYKAKQYNWSITLYQLQYTFNWFSYMYFTQFTFNWFSFLKKFYMYFNRIRLLWNFAIQRKIFSTKTDFTHFNLFLNFKPLPPHVIIRHILTLHQEHHMKNWNYTVIYIWP